MTGGSFAPTSAGAVAEVERAGIPAAKSPAAYAARAIAPASTRRRRSTRKRSRSGRTAHTIASEPSTATFDENSVCIGAIRSAANSPIPTAYARRGPRLPGTVFGSVIMKNRKTRISGEVTSTHQK